MKKNTGTPGEAAYPEGTDAPALYQRSYAGKFLLRPEVLTDEDVMDILKQAFSQSGMKEIVAESVKGRVAGESLTE
mgnify:CR=1 FL=1